MIEIDGSEGEGGGQIARTALALSTLTGKPFRVFDIRKNRPEPGLKAQHLTAITALKQICDAETNEVHVGSTELVFTPGKIKGGAFSFDIGTAGSISLLLQAILPPLLFAPKKVTLTLTGGTCGLWQAPVEYFQHVLLPHISTFCADVRCTILKRGYYPRGGGKAVVEIKPSLSLNGFDSFDLFLHTLKEKIKPLHLTEQGELVQIKGISHASLQLAERKVAERQAEAACMELSRYNVPVDIQSEYQETLSVGTGITLWARFNKEDEFHTVLGTDALGERGKSAEDVGREAAAQLAQDIDSGAAIDKHLADQLLPFLALVGGGIRTSEVSTHAHTNMSVIEKFLPVKFAVRGATISTQ